jgi:hypothetical protein
VPIAFSAWSAASEFLESDFKNWKSSIFTKKLFISFKKFKKSHTHVFSRNSNAIIFKNY